MYHHGHLQYPAVAGATSIPQDVTPKAHSARAYAASAYAGAYPYAQMGQHMQYPQHEYQAGQQFLMAQAHSAMIAASAPGAGAATQSGGNLYSFTNLAPGVVVSRADLEKLHGAIESLYKDRIFPSELTVKARLKTLSVANHILQVFTQIYSALPYYSVGKVPRSGNQQAILFKHGYEGFKGWVDATSDEDTYPPELWDSFGEYLMELVNLRSTQRHCPVSFHRGRYGMSVELHKLNLDFFRDRTLGEVCHIVELAIQKKLLLYENNMLLPALACDSLTNAMHGKPTATAGCHHPYRESEYIQSMDDLKAILHFLLDSYPEGFNLSTLKTKIRNVFGKRLSETVFHQTKLLDLVQLSPLDQIVTVVKLEGNCGYLCTANRAAWSIWKNKSVDGNKTSNSSRNSSSTSCGAERNVSAVTTASARNSTSVNSESS